MFEGFVKRVGRKAERRVEARVAELTERMRAELPKGVAAEAEPGGVVLIGRGLRRRFVLEAALRWLLR